MSHRHRYEVRTTWTGNQGDGTATYRGYKRWFETTAPERPALLGSSDPSFRGDADRWNPELLLVAALSECHMLVYLHLCAVAGVVVIGYVDDAEGVMVESRNGGGRFDDVVLRPTVTVATPGMTDSAQELHSEASAGCFIASSVNFPVRHQPRIIVGSSRPLDSQQRA